MLEMRERVKARAAEARKEASKIAAAKWKPPTEVWAVIQAITGLGEQAARRKAETVSDGVVKLYADLMSLDHHQTEARSKLNAEIQALLSGETVREEEPEQPQA